MNRLKIGLEASTPNQKNITASFAGETPLCINGMLSVSFSQGGKNG